MKSVKCTYRETSFSYKISCEEDVPLLQPPPDAFFVFKSHLLLDPASGRVMHINTQIVVPDEHIERARKVLRRLYSEADTYPYTRVYDIYLRDYEILAILRRILRELYPDIIFEKIVEELEYRKLENEVEIKYTVRRL